MTPPSQAQPPRQPPRQQTVLVARSFLRHALSAVCRSRLEGAARVRARARARARASASVAAAAAESAATTAAEADGAAFEEPSSSLLDRWFRPARFGDVPNRLLAAPAAGGGGGTGACCGSARSRGGDSSGDDGGDAHADDGDAAPTEGEDWAAAISSELCGWLERGAPVPGGHRRQPQHQRQGGGILDRLLGLPSRPRPWSGGGAEGNDGDARAAEEGDGDGGGGGQGNGRGGGAATTATTATAAVLVVATWIRGTAGEGDDEDDDFDEEDDGNEENDEEERNDDWNRPADGVILERFRFSLRPAPTPTPPPTPATSTSTSAASAHSRYFAQLRTALRTLRGYCDGDDSKAMVDPTEEVDYDAVGRAFTFVVEEEVEEMEEEEEVEDNEEQEKTEVEGDENACGLFTKASRHNPLDDHHALTMLRCRRRWTSSNDVDGASASTDSSSSYDDNDDDDEDGLGSSTLTTNRGMAADDMYSMNHTDAGIDASDLAGGGTATMMMMMAQQTQSQSQSQADHWTERTERTADGTDDQSATGKDGQSQSQSQFTEAKNGEDYTHSQSLYFGDDDGSSDGDDDDDDDDNGGVDRYHLGSIDLGDRLLSVSVERSICAPNSPVVRLLFGDDDDASDNTMEAESATSRSESRRQRDDDMFSVTTTLPSQGAMGYSLYRHMQPIDAHPSHDDNLEGGSDDASNGSMVTPPPPMSTILVRTNSDARQADLNGSIESTQPSQGTGFSTQQSSITEGASQRSRRRKGSKKKKSARARANADVSKIMGVRRRDCIPRTRKSKSPPALTPMPPAGNAARSTGKRPALASALRNGSGKRPALSNAANNRSTRFSPLPKVGNGGGNTPMRRAFGTSSRSPAISSTSTVLLGSAANNTPVPVGGASGRSPAISGTSTATVLMSRYGSVSEAETVLMSRTPTPPRKGMGRQG